MKAWTVIAGILLATAAGCAAHKSGTGDRGSACFSNDDCRGDTACFLGNCVDAGAGLGGVEIDVQPAVGSTSLPQRLSQNFDGTSGPQDLGLAPTLQIQGSVTGFTGPVNGTVRIDLVGNDPCPALIDTTSSVSSNDTLSYQATIADATFTIAAVPGRYRVVMTPDQTHALPPIVLPSDTSCGMDIANGTVLTIPYPTTTNTVSGRLRYSNDDTTGVAGAKIQVTAVNATGGPLLSSSIETAADGSFSLPFPPGGSHFAVLVRPGTNTGVPTQSFTVSPAADGTVGDLILNVSAAMSVVINVTDASGLPATDTTITATGTVGDNNQGTVSVSAATTATGQVILSLRAGIYDIIAVPRASSTNGLAWTPLTITAGAAPAPLPMVVPPKATVTGVVLNSAAVPVTNAHVTYKLRGIATDREVTATTTSDGSYSIAVDTVSPVGDPAGAEYEVVIEPASDSKDPRHRELVRVSGPGEVDIDLFSAAIIYGTVYDADGATVPLAALLFYSRIATSDPLLVGLAQTTSVGQFAVPLPQP